jgi:hypothetical protein
MDSTLEANKELVRRFIEGVFVRQDPMLPMSSRPPTSPRTAGDRCSRALTH